MCNPHLSQATRHSLLYEDGFIIRNDVAIIGIHSVRKVDIQERGTTLLNGDLCAEPDYLGSVSITHECSAVLRYPNDTTIDNGPALAPKQEGSHKDQKKHHDSSVNGGHSVLSYICVALAAPQ
jgi:hypothetical protein